MSGAEGIAGLAIGTIGLSALSLPPLTPSISLLSHKISEMTTKFSVPTLLYRDYAFVSGVKLRVFCLEGSSPLRNASQALAILRLSQLLCRRFRQFNTFSIKQTVFEISSRFSPNHLVD